MQQRKFQIKQGKTYDGKECWKIYEFGLFGNYTGVQIVKEDVDDFVVYYNDPDGKPINNILGRSKYFSSAKNNARTRANEILQNKKREGGKKQ